MDIGILIEVGKVLAVLLMMAFGMGAKVLDPLRSSEARGRVGGTIYNTTRGTKYVKSFTSPAQPRTKRQLAIRALCQIATRAWQALLATDRTAWNNYAAASPEIDWTGQPQRKTGANLFVRSTTRLLDAGLTQVDTPPAIPAPDGLLAFAAADGILQSVLTWTPTAATYVVEVFMQGPISPGVSPKREKAKLALPRGDGDLGAVTITGLTPGTWAFFGRVMDSATGLISTYALDSAVITAA